MSEKMKTLLVRTLSGAVLAVAVIGATVWSVWSYGALLLLLLVGCMSEFYALAARWGQRPQRWIGMVTGVALFAANYVTVCWQIGEIEAVTANIASFFLGLLCFIQLAIPLMFICELYRREEHPAAGIGVTLAGVCYVALPVAVMCYIPMFGPQAWNPWVMVAYIAIIWANDVFAYLVGMSIGRHPLFPRLSPKKSWEGFFGGLAGAVAAGAVAARLLDADVWAWIGLALVAAATGVLGDLAESMFKRAAGVKDSGNIIPGHGGWLDRFDALILSAPFVFVYILIFIM